MAIRRTSSFISFSLILMQLILFGITAAQCPKGSVKEKICTSCSRLPKANHFSDYCCTQKLAQDFCSKCLKNLFPCIRELTNLLGRRAPIMKEEENSSGDMETKKRTLAEIGEKSFYPNLFSKRVPEILVPAPPVDVLKRQASNPKASK